MRVCWIVLGLMVSLLACGDYKHREPRTPTAPEWMVQQVDAQAKQVAPDAAPVTPLYRNIAYKRNDNGKWPLELQQGSCYLVSTVGDETVERFYVLLWDTKGDRKIETKQPAPGLVAEYCATESGTHELEVKIAGGHGHFLTQVFAKGGAAPTAAAGADEPAPPPPPAANPATPEPAADPIASRIASLAMAAAGAERVGEMREGAADVTDWYVALEPSKCYWFFAVGDEGVERLSLFLWDPNNKRVADSKSETAEVELGHCPKGGGMFHVQAKIAKGSGRYGMSVYSKPR